MPVCLVRDRGRGATRSSDICSHADVSLSEGEVDGRHDRVLAARLPLRPRTGKPDRACRPPSRSPSTPSRSRATTSTSSPRPRSRGEHCMATLEIRDLHVTVDAEDGPREILRGVDLTVRAGRDPRDHGAERLRQVDAGVLDRRAPEVPRHQGTVTLDGDDVLAMTVDERARAGLFLAMQYPVEIPGVSVSQLPAHGRDRRARRGAQAARRGSRTSTARWTGSRIDPVVRRRATSTRASPAGRRSATRSCSSSCSSRRSRSSTRPTPVWTSTRCGSSPRASTGSARAARSASC